MNTVKLNLYNNDHYQLDQYALELNGYVCYVPFVENEIFLKSIIPSRKLDKEFKGESDG